MAYPTNVLHFATECYNKNHSAVFPKSLPEWFIKLFTKEHDWLLDPFVGSGTTSEVAQDLQRNSVGIDILPKYCDIAKQRTAHYQYKICEKVKEYEYNNTKKITTYVEQNIPEFHRNRINKLKKLKLTEVLKRKNPYLFKVKHILTAGDFIKTILDAHLSSQEETPISGRSLLIKDCYSNGLGKFLKFFTT